MPKTAQPFLARRYWRSFLPIWLFPVAFLATLAMPGFSTHPRTYFFLFDAPLIGLCAYPALRRWRQGGRAASRSSGCIFGLRSCHFSSGGR